MEGSPSISAVGDFEAPMPFVRFQELEVYQLAEQLSDAVWDIVVKWNHFAQDTVGKQLTRSADSIGANIAEGAGLDTDKQNQRHVRIARGSLLETQHWLRRAYTRKLLTEDETRCLQPMVQKLAPKLNAYLRSIGRRKRKPPEGE
jgi:four helix bundle protein